MQDAISIVAICTLIALCLGTPDLLDALIGYVQHLSACPVTVKP